MTFLTQVKPLLRQNSGIQASMIGWNVWGLNKNLENNMEAAANSFMLSKRPDI